MSTAPPSQLVVRLALSAVLPTALIACGGGGSNATSSVAAADVSADGRMTVLAIDAATASDSATTPSSGTTTLAVEGGTFNFSGTQTVRYGAGTAWITMSVTAYGVCSNGFFGGDPQVGTVKSCQLVPEVPSNSLPVTEGSNFTVSGTQTVRYGAGSYWIIKSITGTGQCSNAYFGSDPLFGTVKACELVVGSTSSSSNAGNVTAWVRAAAENDTYAPTGTQTLRFGDGMHWVTKTVSAATVCSVGTFGSDPAYGTGKFCEVQVTVPAVTQINGQMPVINQALTPAAAAPVMGPRVRALSAAELAISNFQPSPSTIGSFREPCAYSHFANDDPIVFPGQPGASHLHIFGGNSDTNSTSTADTITSSGGSTCSGGTLNRTAYWFPALVDTRTGQPLVPVAFNTYYKLGYYGVTAGTVQPFPRRLRILHGNSNSSPTSPDTSFTTRFACASGSGWTSAIPSCAIGDQLMGAVVFPQCWDGVNLDSPDHKSHMAYGTGLGCPSTHPVPLPEITMNIVYLITEANTGSYYKLSSDNYSGPGGYSLHADWFGGWDASTESAFITKCINGNQDCHEMLLGDGRILY